MRPQIASFNTILLVEDDQFLRKTMRQYLEDEDFLIIEAANGQRAIEILNHHKINLVLLDLNLPDGKGLDFITAIREQSNIPVIIVSGELDEQLKIQTIEAGADDFVSKPAQTDMLIAKMRAQLRRYHNNFQNTPNNQDNNIDYVLSNGWVFDTQKMQIFDQGGHTAELTAKEFQLLGLLIKMPGKTFSRNDLCQAIREEKYIPTERAIDIKIARIRKKIGDSGPHPSIIKTIRGVGYMFNKDMLDTA